MPIQAIKCEHSTKKPSKIKVSLRVFSGEKLHLCRHLCSNCKQEALQPIFFSAASARRAFGKTAATSVGGHPTNSLRTVNGLLCNNSYMCACKLVKLLLVRAILVQVVL